MTTMSEAVRNGVETSVLFATLDAVKQHPELGPVPVPSDEYLDRWRAWQTMFSEVQAAKTFVGETAAGMVDRALMLSGGASLA